MKIGYPCINWTLGCKGDKTFRLKSYSEERLIETVGHNLDCLAKVLEFNVAHNILFFRITSDLVPFASHPVCKFDWAVHFAGQFEKIGESINRHDMRISMHPDQFTLINSPDEGIFERSTAELLYHARVLDAMRLDPDAKIQIHLGGVYNDRAASIHRFIERYSKLPSSVKKRLVIENDDVSYPLSDCLTVHQETGIPVLFDVYHDSVKPCGLTFQQCLDAFTSTWTAADGLPMLDYSSAHSSGRKGKHADSIDAKDFRKFLKASGAFDFDIMLEIKDKEKSALKAIQVAKNDPRFVRP